MSSTEERVIALVAANLEVDGQPLGGSLNLEVSLVDHGVSSLDLVAFAKVVAQDFGVSFSTEDCGSINTIRGLIDFLDG